MDYPKPQTEPEVKPPSRARRVFNRGLRWLVYLLVVFVILTLLTPLAYRFWKAGEFENAVGEAEAGDPGMVLWDDLEKQRPTPVDAENAALVIHAAVKGLNDNWDQPAEVPADAPEILAPGSAASISQVRERLSPRTLLPPTLAKILANHAAATQARYDQLRRLSDLQLSHYPGQRDRLMTGSDSRLEVLVQARAASDLCRKYALHYSQQNQAEQAVDAVQRMLAAGRSLDQEPGLIPGLQHLAIDVAVVRHIEKLLGLTEPDESSLRALQSAVARQRSAPVLLWALRGERAQQIELYRATFAGQPTALNGQTSSGGSGAGALIMSYTHHGWWQDNGAMTTRWLSRLVDAAKLPPEQLSARLQAIGAEQRAAQDSTVLYRERFALAVLLMPAIFKVSESYVRQQAMLACGEAAVAAERFRRQERRWPEQLAEMTPKYLKEVPTDPYSGKPLLLRRTPNGLIIYSVFTNGVDDGGKIRSDPDSPFKEWTYDAGVQLWDPSARRRTE